MGKPGGGHAPSRRSEYIGPSSKPREVNHLSTGRKRKKFDSVSSGERKRISPNSRASGFSGVVGQSPDQIRGVTNRVSRRVSLERAATEGDSPVAERHRDSRPCSRVPRDTWNPVGIREDHLPRLNTSQRPIVNQYREGKVKSTPVRGVK